MKIQSSIVALTTLLAGSLVPAHSHACGGLFCSAAAPVVQSAERIVFVDNGDQTMSMMVEILYSGPSASFAWVLPVSGVPTIAVGSTRALAALDQGTRPVFQTNFEGSFCPTTPVPTSSGVQDASVGFIDASAPPGVVVEAQGSVGPYDYVIISVDPGLPSPAEAGKQWLMDNGYDLSGVGADLLAAYLMGGQNLLAFRLTKNATTGSIRPVIMTYGSNVPVIPIRPTALAAQADMGVLVFLYGASRAVPTSFDEIVIPDEAIDWTNPAASYRSLVSSAVDAADGHAFVTERASAAPRLTIDAAGARASLAALGSFAGTDRELIGTAIAAYSLEDGISDALARQGISPRLPGDEGPVATTPVTFSVYFGCLGCFALYVPDTFDRAAFLADLDALVVTPLEETLALFARRPYLTRLFTTLDPSEMDVDPVFTYPAGLEVVSNLHLATIVTQCDGGTNVRFTRFPNGRSIPTTTPPAELPKVLLRYDYSSSGVRTLVEDNSAALLASTSPTDPPITTVTPRSRGAIGGGRCALARDGANAGMGEGASAAAIGMLLLVARRLSRGPSRRRSRCAHHVASRRPGSSSALDTAP